MVKDNEEFNYNFDWSGRSKEKALVRLKWTSDRYHKYETRE